MITLATISDDLPSDEWLHVPIYVSDGGPLAPAGQVRLVTTANGSRCIVLSSRHMEIIQQRRPRKKAGN